MAFLMAMAIAKEIFSALLSAAMSMTDFFSAAIGVCCRCVRYPHRIPTWQPGGSARHRGVGRAKMPAGQHGGRGG